MNSIHQISLRFLLVTALLAAASALAFPVFAQESKPQAPAQPLWEIGLAGAGASIPAYLGAKENVSRFLVLPYFIYRGEVLRADRDTAGARFVKTPDYEFDVGFGGSLGASSKDVPARAGMPSLGNSIEFGPRFKYNIARPSPDSKVTFALPLRTVLEFKSGLKQRGWVLEPALSYDKRNLIAGWGFNANAAALVGDAKIQNYLYGVAPEFANANRASYTAKSGLIATRLGIATSKSLSPDSTIAIFARWDNAGVGANKNSPLHLKNNGFLVGVGLTYTFFRSGTTARESSE
jgi:MipA family protein